MYFKVSQKPNYVTIREDEKKKCPSRFRTLTDYHNNNDNNISITAVNDELNNIINNFYMTLNKTSLSTIKFNLYLPA